MKKSIITATLLMTMGLFFVSHPAYSDDVPTLTCDSDGFVEIPAGTFKMGRPAENKSKIREVTITKSFYMCNHEVTQKEYVSIMGVNESCCKVPNKPAVEGEVPENRPVERVNWYAAITYCNKKSLADGLTPCYTVEGIEDWVNLKYRDIPTEPNAKWNLVKCDWTANGYRLPTEAEWEYAARAGEGTTSSAVYSGTRKTSKLKNYAWFRDNSNDATHEVMKKEPNAFGLYDMSGNVTEWCWDWYSDYSSDPLTDPKGPQSGAKKVIRGGCWNLPEKYATVTLQRSLEIDRDYINQGFRLARSTK